MTEHEIKRVAVVGAGTMGAQIASLIAIHGYPVAVTDAVPEALSNAITRIDGHILPELDRAGIGTRSLVDARANLTFLADLEQAIAGVDLVIEAVREDVDIKIDLFGRLDAINETAILASNSSSIPTRQIIGKVGRPGRVLNMNFFAPILIRTMLEVMT